MRQKISCIIPLSRNKKNGGVCMGKTFQGSARTTNQDAQQHQEGLSQEQSREDSIGASLLSTKGKYDFVLLWEKSLTFVCVHRCWSKATEINTNICMDFQRTLIRPTVIWSSWHVGVEAESGSLHSSWFFALLFTLTGEESLHHQHPGWGHYPSSKSGQGKTRMSERERGGGMMGSLFSSCAE